MEEEYKINEKECEEYDISQSENSDHDSSPHVDGTVPKFHSIRKSLFDFPPQEYY